MRKLIPSLFAFALIGLCSSSALAAANYVYHEQTGNNTDANRNSGTPGTCGKYTDNTDRSASGGFQIYSPESYTLRFKVEFQFFTNQVRVFYTTNGTDPSTVTTNVGGVIDVDSANASTSELVASYTCVFPDGTLGGQLVDVATATIPAQPVGTTVKYIVVAWHTGGGDVTYGNSGPGGGFNCNASTCATVQTYSVVAAPAVPLIISEYRMNGLGPTGGTISQQDDEFVEIYNNSEADFTVNAFDGSAGYALAASDGLTRFTIPNNTTIPARGHFLGVNPGGYSLGGPGGYPTSSGSTFATGDATFTIGLRNGGPGEGTAPDGIALFNTANPANFTLANRLDAVGSAGTTNTLYKEGGGHPDITNFNADYSLVRDLKTGTPKDTGDNRADFLLVETRGIALCPPDSTPDFQCERLGAPGPENLSSPVQRNATIKPSLIDPGCTGITTSGTGQPTNDTNTTCARHRDATSNPANNSTHGTLSIRRRFTNTTGAPVTRLRFRIIDITASPAASPLPAGTADLRAISSSDYTATCVGTGGGCAAPGATVDIRGTTLEQLPAQPRGGAINSTLSAGTITLANQLANGASINIQFLLGVEQNGAYRFFVNVEALPTGVAAFTEARQYPTKRGARKAGASPRRE